MNAWQVVAIVEGVILILLFGSAAVLGYVGATLDRARMEIDDGS